MEAFLIFKLASGKQPVLTFDFRGPRAPVVVSCENAPQCEVLLMPCALDGETAPEPDRQGKLFEGTDDNDIDIGPQELVVDDDGDDELRGSNL